MPECFWNHGLYANLKKWQFHKDEVQLLEFVVLAKRITMKEENIEIVRDLAEPKLVGDIKIFLSFANFDKRFIKNFSRIIALLTLILQTTGKFAGNEF